MDIMVLFSAFAYTCAAYCVMLLACELTQRSSDYFTNIEDIVVQWHWYLFPGEIKRLLPLILLVVQQPVEIECFGGIVCNRELYKKVCIWSKRICICHLFCSIDDNNKINGFRLSTKVILILPHSASLAVKWCLKFVTSKSSNYYHWKINHALQFWYFCLHLF